VKAAMPGNDLCDCQHKSYAVNYLMTTRAALSNQQFVLHSPTSLSSGLTTLVVLYPEWSCPRVLMAIPSVSM